MKPKNYYSRYSHFLKIDLSKVSSFREIKNWLKNSKKIVDVGCGVGHLTNYWGATGIDVDKKAIEIAKKRFPKTKFMYADATKKLPFNNRSVESIVCYNILEHLTECQRKHFFKQAKRILKKDGIFIAGYIDEEYWMNKLLAKLFKNYGINDPTHKVRWRINDFRNEIEKNFKIIKEKRTSPYGRMVFFTRHLKGETVILSKNL